ncbi:hypothetical protein INT43_002429 [Umbelopsis isabellina]|uniref:Uncharacterized protein n=1 Tax=Mortierella isabellina TaxID=91625 RepID=A0A8H7UHG9_MORIS|nr:hypothetical protein INT43_002429 [Umbelopsis isabellina]
MTTLRTLRPTVGRILLTSKGRIATTSIAISPAFRLSTRTFTRQLSIKSLFASNSDNDAKLSSTQRILTPDNLFHPISESPVPEIRDRGTIIRKYGMCPVCNEEHHGHREQMRSPAYECPDCGHPTHCSEEHYQKGKDEHSKICHILREHNEDEHDLRSGRPMKEFEFPSAQGFDEAVNMANWDVFFYTRSFPSMDSDRSMRHVSKLLTYPITIASALHESSPHRKQVTAEGLRSLAAIRSILYPKVQLARDGVTLLRTETVNLYLLGARAESTLPPHIWSQLAYLFPQTPFHIHFVGPDALPPNREPYTTSLNDQLTFTYDNAMYHDYHEKVGSFDPYKDVYFLFAPGLGHPSSRESWKASIAKALDTKCAMFITGFDKHDVETDVKTVEEDHAEDFDWILRPTENHFKSLKRDINLQDLTQAIFANWGIWGIRGKRYEVTHNPEEDD